MLGEYDCRTDVLITKFYRSFIGESSVTGLEGHIWW